MTILRSIIRSVFQCVYAIYSLVRKKENILFIYSNNSRQFRNMDLLQSALKKYFVSVKVIDASLTISNIKEIASAQIIFLDQTTKITSTIRIFNKTKVIQIWHAGGAYKCVGFDAWNGTRADLNRIKRIHGNNDYIVTSDKKLTPIYAQAFNLKQERVLPIGLLRSDQYFNLKIDHSEKVVLFAPTFRTNKSGLRYLSYGKEEILQLKTKLENIGYRLALRLHPSIKNIKISGILDWSNDPLEEILPKTSLLITDYSSIIFDYCIFPGATFWLIPDVREYKKERGTYFDPVDFFPRYSATTIEDLVNKINAPFEQNNQVLREEFMSECDGHSIERMVKFVNFLIKQEKNK